MGYDIIRYSDDLVEIGEYEQQISPPVVVNMTTNVTTVSYFCNIDSNSVQNITEIINTTIITERLQINVCEYGCDDISNLCYMSPLMEGLYIILMILGLFFIIWWVRRALKRRRR